jgi:hypothetical protein
MNIPDKGWLTIAVGVIVCVFLGGVALRILWLMWNDKIDLSAIVSETNGDASMSRLQLLLFTFVIAVSILMMVENKMAFPEISNGVLMLLGISASTYAVGKSISYSEIEGRQKPPDPADPALAVQLGAVAGAMAGARTGAQTGAQAGAQTGAQTGAQAGAAAGAAAAGDGNAI